MKKDLLERLEEYCGADYVPLHMPGAKRNTQEFVMPNPYAIDITEIDGFDNMHHAEDILKEAFERTANVPVLWYTSSTMDAATSIASS